MYIYHIIATFRVLFSRCFSNADSLSPKCQNRFAATGRVPTAESTTKGQVETCPFASPRPQEKSCIRCVPFWLLPCALRCGSNRRYPFVGDVHVAAGSTRWQAMKTFEEEFLGMLTKH